MASIGSTFSSPPDGVVKILETPGPPPGSAALDQAINNTTNSAGLNGLIGFAFQTSSGVVILPTLDAMGRVQVVADQHGTWIVGRSWTLSSSTDSVAAVQSGLWNINNITGTVTITGTVNAAQSGTWTTGRTWTLSSGTDSIAAAQSGSWSVAQSGAWTTGRTWTLSNGTDSVAATQSGTWTTGRTWSLLNSTDSVNAVQSGAWTAGRTWTLSNATDTVTNTPATSSTATVTSVAVALISVVIVASNANRRGLILYNNSANSVYITFAATGNSSTTLAYIIPTFTQIVLQAPVYTGVISAIRNAGTGNVVGTELT